MRVQEGRGAQVRPIRGRAGNESQVRVLDKEEVKEEVENKTGSESLEDEDGIKFDRLQISTGKSNQEVQDKIKHSRNKPTEKLRV